MYYEINVSKNGRHYFATAERSITTERELKIIVADFVEKFKEEDGFHMTVSLYKAFSQHIDVETILGEDE